MHQEYPRMQVELNSFSSKTITETTTETTTTILKLYVQDSLSRELGNYKYQDSLNRNLVLNCFNFKGRIEC